MKLQPEDQNMQRWKLLLVAFFALTMLLVTNGCDREPTKVSSNHFTLPVLKPRFEAQKLTWAQGDVIHYGNQALRIGKGHIETLHLSPVGFFVEVAAAPDGGDKYWALFDGQEVRRLPRAITSLEVSPNGRYVGWVNLQGPHRPAGRVAEAVILDLTTGLVAGRTSDGMGGEAGDDLGQRYEDLPPEFLGFDDEYAFYRDASGSGTARTWDLKSGRIGTVSNGPNTAYEKTPWQGEVDELNGFVTADGRYALDTSRTGRVRVFTIAGSRRSRLDLDFGRRWETYGYLLTPDQLVVLTMDTLEMSYDPAQPDHTHGAVTVCNLVKANCRDAVDVIGTRNVVFPTGTGF
jgi:hypothetical protein